MKAVNQLLREGALRVVDHALAQTLHRLDPATPEPVLLAAALASRAIAQGHGALRLAMLDALLAELLADHASTVRLPDAAVFADALASSSWVARGDGGDGGDAGKPLAFDGERVYLRRYFDYERRLAAGLRRLAANPLPAVDAGWRDTRLRALFPHLADDAGDPQAAAARAALTAPVLLLTGGPGTGKTTTVARMLALLVESLAPPPRIQLAAPTGKAAARLSESLRANLAALEASGAITSEIAQAIPSEARTLHRLLGVRPGSTRFRHDAAHPLPLDLLVVDEVSMVDLPLMTKLVEALPDGARLVLIGDRDQLPSVETGAVLAALCDAADAGAAALRRAQLARSWRQQSGFDLAPLATAVREGEADAALAILREDACAGVRWRLGGERALADALARDVVPAYRALATAGSPAEALARARELRVLTGLREGGTGCVALNALLARALAPPGTRADRPFHGRLLMVSANSYRHGLYNGDTGIVWRDDDGTPRVWFETGEGLRAFLPAALPAHEDAFALTVHKAQGSEFDRVWLVLPERDARVLSRELVYTGLTRARRELLLWADEAVLRAAIARRAQRWSGLAARFGVATGLST